MLRCLSHAAPWANGFDAVNERGTNLGTFGTCSWTCLAGCYILYLVTWKVPIVPFCSDWLSLTQLLTCSIPCGKSEKGLYAKDSQMHKEIEVLPSLLVIYGVTCKETDLSPPRTPITKQHSTWEPVDVAIFRVLTASMSCATLSQDNTFRSTSLLHSGGMKTSHRLFHQPKTTSLPPLETEWKPTNKYGNFHLGSLSSTLQLSQEAAWFSFGHFSIYLGNYYATTRVAKAGITPLWLAFTRRKYEIMTCRWWQGESSYQH